MGGVELCNPRLICVHLWLCLSAIAYRRRRPTCVFVCLLNQPISGSTESIFTKFSPNDLVFGPRLLIKLSFSDRSRDTVMSTNSRGKIGKSAYSPLFVGMDYRNANGRINSTNDMSTLYRVGHKKVYSLFVWVNVQ